ncbi:substrate-binding domain-containing protein [Chitinivorax sp. B]|uniref:substrate-binding domain-containing protein n=1 Tax=Chitinivorax sp. B TaxID=2502235 RepID=UPI0010F77F97|nr:substrate-binding domain-containing protein [Chitinivorax sp. B]
MNRRQFNQWASLLLAQLLASPGHAAGKPVIGMLLKSMRNEFFKLMADAAQKYYRAKASEFELLLDGVQEETDVKGQEDIIKRWAGRQLDALIVVPADSVTLLPTLLKAIERGCLVINMDNKLDDRALAAAGVNIPFVGPSNFAGAKSVGEYVARQLPAGSFVGLIEGPPNSINAKARSDGFRAALRAANMNVAGIRSGFWEVEKGKAAALELLKAFPDIKALLCGNDNMAIGAAAAVNSRSATVSVLVAGYDHIPAIRPLIAEGKVAATADQHPETQVEFAIDLATNAVKKRMMQSELPTIVQTPVQLITQ